MAVPTLSTCTPSSGLAAGRSLVVLVGTNFRAPAAGAYGNPEDSPTPTVAVTFGGVAVDSTEIWVLSDTQIECVPPAYSGDADLQALGPVAITVQNLDDDGIAIPGELASLAAAYTYTRAPLRPPTRQVQGPYEKVLRAIIRGLKRQTLLDSGHAAHTDYSADGIEVLRAATPALVVTNLRVYDDDYGHENEPYWETQLDGSALRYPCPTMHTLTVDILGYSDDPMEFLALMAATRKFVRDNPYLLVGADVPAGSVIRLPLVSMDDPASMGGVARANLGVFKTTWEIRRVPVLYLPPNAKTSPITQAELQAQNLVGVLVETVTL